MDHNNGASPARSGRRCLTKPLNPSVDYKYNRGSLPSYTYRVQHENSITRFQANIGRIGRLEFPNAFQARGRHWTTIGMEDDLSKDLTQKRVMEHLDWYNTQPVSYISMFDSKSKSLYFLFLH